MFIDCFWREQKKGGERDTGQLPLVSAPTGTEPATCGPRGPAPPGRGSSGVFILLKEMSAGDSPLGLLQKPCFFIFFCILIHTIV